MESIKGKEVKFSVKQVYKDLANEGDEVNYSPMIWFALCVPNTHMWMTIHERLYTQDKI